MDNSKKPNQVGKLTFSQMLQATLTRNEKFDGKFYFGVLTTRIYCLPSCKARKPLEKNIVFFINREDAIIEGFRGCKRCRAEYYPNNNPPWFDATFNLLKNSVEKKISEYDLVRVAGVNISTIRRYFKNRFYITPLAYHRKIRLVYARRLIEEGNSCLEVGYQCGFRSSSGFREAFIREFGVSPGKIQETSK